MEYRVCRCCDKKYNIITELPSGKKIPRNIKCGFCGDMVDQNCCNFKYGKWFHDPCVGPYNNLIKSMKSNPYGALKLNAVNAFRDFILMEMIQRKDLRQLKKHWEFLVKSSVGESELLKKFKITIA